MKPMLDELTMLMDGINRPLKLMEVCGTHTVEIFSSRVGNAHQNIYHVGARCAPYL